MEEDLKKLGLTENEIKVYLSLLKVGETSVGGIINDLKIHRQIAYNALSSLESRNMVTKTVKNKIHHYKISDPKIILENLQKQELIAKRISKNIQAEMKKSKHEHEINIYEGSEQIHRFYLDKYKSLPSETTFYLMSPEVTRITKVLGDEFFYKKAEKIRTNKKIYSKNVMSYVFKEQFEKMSKRLNPELRETRYLPYKSATPVTTIIWPNSVCYQSLFTDAFIIEIKNQELRDSFIDHFDMLWQIAKK